MRLFKKLFVFIIAIAGLCLEQIVTACGGGEDPYDDYLSFFHNNTAGSAVYLPFYYVSGYEYYEDWNGPMQQDLDNDKNLEEWISYGKRRFSVKDAEAFIYHYSYSDLSNIYYHIEQNKTLSIPDSVRHNEMTQWFLTNKDFEALGYLMYAKRCEAHAGRTSAWEIPEKDKITMEKLIKNGLQLHKAAQKDFFQWRYAYQIIRLAFYSEDYNHTLKLTQELIDNKTANNIMYFRCLSLKAGAFYRLGDYSTAAYLYAIAFDGTDDNKFSNYISYNWCFRAHETNTDKGLAANKAATMALAQNNREKAIMTIMDALHEYDDGFPLMAHAYELNKEVNGLEVVMTREINKMESRFLDPALRNKSGFNNYYYAYNNYYYNRNNKAYVETKLKEAEQLRIKLNNMIAFGEKVYVDQKRKEEAAFWPLSIAYLFFIKEDWANCQKWLTKAEQLKPEGKMADMLHMEKLLLDINKNEKIDATVEKNILPSLEWLEHKALNDVKYAITYRNIMTSILANMYIKQQDTIKALLSIAKGIVGPDGNGVYTHWYYSEIPAKRQYINPGFSLEMEQVTTANIVALRNRIADHKKTPFDSWLVKYPPYQEGALNMYIATRYLRQHDFTNAVLFLENIPDSFQQQYTFPDPFAERWIDTQEPKEVLSYSDKYKFAQEMQKLQSGLTKANAQHLYKYANGLYSMTYYGLAWKAAMYYRSGSDILAYYADSARQNLLPEYRNYYTAEEPMKYYQLAYEKTKDKELKAKCLYMLSKCWQKNASVSRQYFYSPANDDNYFQYNMQSPYFKLLMDHAETHAYNTIYEECAYFRSYIIKTSK